MTGGALHSSTAYAPRRTYVPWFIHSIFQAQNVLQQKVHFLHKRALLDLRYKSF